MGENIVLGGLDLSRRLTFFRIDESVQSSLAQSADKLLDGIETTMEEFFAHLDEYDETRAVLSGHNPERLAASQVAHWRSLFAEGITEQYIERAHHVGLAHYRSGVGTSFYIGGYSMVLSKVSRAVQKHFDGEEANELLSALIKFFMIDLEIAMTVYLEAAEREKSEALDRVTTELNAEVRSVSDDLVNQSSQLMSALGGMSNVINQVNSGAATVAAASEQASVNVNAVASATEEMSASVREIGRQADTSRNISDRAVSEADRATQAISGLGETASEIGNVLKLITDIASQTNLLALNATIEAARAGEAGRGFAVVASEVKSLANETARATETIGSQIGNIQEAAGNVTSVITGIQGVINEMKANVDAIAGAVTEQTTVTEEISRNVQEAAKGTREVSESIQSVAAQTAEADRLSQDIQQIADATQNEASVLQSSMSALTGRLAGKD